MHDFNIGWYVIYTKSRHEKKVAQQLGGMELQYFLPTTRILRIWPTKKKYVQAPLFPSYVFVKLEKLQHYFDSLQIPGVLYFVKIGNQVASIKETIIHKLQAIISNKLDDIEVLSEHFNPGTTMNIHAGPFKGFSCEVIEHRGRNKILVRIELLQRNILVDMPSYCLEVNAI